MTPLGSKIRSSQSILRITLIALAISVTFNILTPYYFNVWRRAPVRVVVISGNSHVVADEISIQDAREERIWIAKQAATAIWYRNPAGFPLGGTIDRIVSPAIRKQIRDAAESDMMTFMNLKIDQHFEPTRPIKEMAAADGAYAMQVDGDLIRIWKQDGKDEVHTTPIRILMTLTVNDSGLLLSKFPLIVTKLESNALDDSQKLSNR